MSTLVEAFINENHRDSEEISEHGSSRCQRICGRLLRSCFAEEHAVCSMDISLKAGIFFSSRELSFSKSKECAVMSFLPEYGSRKGRRMSEEGEGRRE